MPGKKRPRSDYAARITQCDIQQPCYNSPADWTSSKISSRLSPATLSQSDFPTPSDVASREHPPGNGSRFRAASRCWCQAFNLAPKATNSRRGRTSLRRALPTPRPPYAALPTPRPPYAAPSLRRALPTPRPLFFTFPGVSRGLSRLGGPAGARDDPGRRADARRRAPRAWEEVLETNPPSRVEGWC